MTNKAVGQSPVSRYPVENKHEENNNLMRKNGRNCTFPFDLEMGLLSFFPYCTFILTPVTTKFPSKPLASLPLAVCTNTKYVYKINKIYRKVFVSK